MVGTSTLIIALVAAIGVQSYVMPHGHREVKVSLEHFEVLKMRASTAVNPAAVTNTQCIDRNV